MEVHSLCDVYRFHSNIQSPAAAADMFSREVLSLFQQDGAKPHSAHASKSMTFL